MRVARWCAAALALAAAAGCNTTGGMPAAPTEADLCRAVRANSLEPMAIGMLQRHAMRATHRLRWSRGELEYNLDRRFSGFERMLYQYEQLAEAHDYCLLSSAGGGDSLREQTRLLSPRIDFMVRHRLLRLSDGGLDAQRRLDIESELAAWSGMPVGAIREIKAGHAAGVERPSGDVAAPGVGEIADSILLLQSVADALGNPTKASLDSRIAPAARVALARNVELRRRLVSAYLLAATDRRNPADGAMDADVNLSEMLLSQLPDPADASCGGDVEKFLSDIEI